MATEKSRFETFGSALKDVVSALRDSVLFLLFLLLLFSPETVKSRLYDAGFTKGSIGGFDWEAQIKSDAEQTKTVGQTVDRANENYGKLIERLSELEMRVTDPTVRATVKNIADVAETSRTDLAGANSAIRRSLAVQQQIVAKISPAKVAESGWILLGKVTEDKSAWSSGSPQTIGPTTPRPIPGTKLTIRDDVYIRATGPSNTRASAPILGAVKAGDTVEVTDIDYSHAKPWGWFVWAKVKRS